MRSRFLLFALEFPFPPLQSQMKGTQEILSFAGSFDFVCTPSAAPAPTCLGPDTLGAGSHSDRCLHGNTSTSQRMLATSPLVLGLAASEMVSPDSCGSIQSLDFPISGFSVLQR